MAPPQAGDQRRRHAASAVPKDMASRLPKTTGGRRPHHGKEPGGDGAARAISMGLLRWLGIHEHDWTPWKVTATGKIHYGMPPLVIMFTQDPCWHVGGEMTRQERRCNSCGLEQTRTEKVDYTE